MEETSIHDLIAILQRRRMVFLITASILFIFAAVISLSWSSYRSTAVVQVQQSDIPSNMTNPLGMSQADVVRALADQRIQQIQQKVTSTAGLVDVITKYDLYAHARLTQPMSDIVEMMRKKIKLDLVSASLASPTAAATMKADQLSAIAFTLQFTYNEPLKTQQVTNELMSRFLDEDLKQRRTQAQETTGFLDTQLKALEASMQEQESRIADFRAQHPESRPEALALNQQLMASTFQNILAVETQLSSVDKTRGDIRGQLASIDPYSRVVADGQMMTTPSVQLKSLQSRYSSIVSQYSPDHPDVVKLRHQIESLQKELGQTQDTAELQSQIDDARTNLSAAESTFGPDHPDVQVLRRRVTSLEGQLAGQARDPSSRGAVKKDADNPAYLMLTSQLNAAEQQYKSLTAQKASLQEQYERYQMNVAQTPAIEQQFASLSRDYDNAQMRYREMKEKKLSADMHEQMEQGRMAERLQVIDPPELPTDTSPKRLILLAAGFVMSAVGGLGGVMLREMVSRSVHGTRHLAELTGARPLVAVPHIFTKEERRSIRRRRLQLAAAGLAILLVAGAIFDQLVMPIDVAGSILFRRLGIS